MIRRLPTLSRVTLIILFTIPSRAAPTFPSALHARFSGLSFSVLSHLCVCVCVRVVQELQAKGGLTEKEKKELKRLKAEEMCEMLGRGC